MTGRWPLLGTLVSAGAVVLAAFFVYQVVSGLLRPLMAALGG